MRSLRAGRVVHHLPDGDCEIALAHSLGRAFIQLQQLEFAIISFLEALASENLSKEATFDFSPQKLLIVSFKKSLNFLVHKFLFNRYGGIVFNTKKDYELLIKEAHALTQCFFGRSCKFYKLHATECAY